MPGSRPTCWSIKTLSPTDVKPDGRKSAQKNAIANPVGFSSSAIYMPFAKTACMVSSKPNPMQTAFEEFAFE
jgi:hypothetical protein